MQLNTLRKLIVLIILTLGLQLFPHSQTAKAAGINVGEHFASYYAAHGGLAIFGYPLTQEFAETDLVSGKVSTVQYFERNRFEWHPENKAPYDVLLGTLGNWAAGKVGNAGFNKVSDPKIAGVLYFPQTNHTLRNAFRSYWESHGGLAIFGYPMSEEFQQSIPGGGSYTVQYFERNRFEWHPENKAPYDVLLGLLGKDYYAQRYPTGMAGWFAGGVRWATENGGKPGYQLVQADNGQRCEWSARWNFQVVGDVQLNWTECTILKVTGGPNGGTVKFQSTPDPKYGQDNRAWWVHGPGGAIASIMKKDGTWTGFMPATDQSSPWMGADFPRGQNVERKLEVQVIPGGIALIHLGTNDGKAPY